MKKSFIAAFIAIAAFASCNKIETAAPSFDELDITFDIADPDPDTKAIKTSWEEGDEILILFENKTENGQQAKLRYVSGEWKVTQKPSNLGLSGNVSIRFLAIHFPGTISYDSTKDPKNQLGYVGGNVRIAKQQTSGVLTSRGVLPLGTINLDQKLNSDEIQIVVPGISAKDFYSLSVTNNGHIIKSSGEENEPYSYGCSYLASYYPYFDGYVTITYGGGIGVIKGVANADGVAFTGYYNDPAARSDSEVKDTDPYKYVFTLFDGENYYHYTLPKNSKKTLAAGKAIKLPAFDGKGSQTNWKREEFENGHSYVDLGIVIGGKRIMWAETNVGASKDDAAGSKFAWGEIETKSSFTWSNYKYSDGSSTSSPKMTKYVTDSYYGTVDNYSELLLRVDDAARASWGGDWRIPNEEEVSALLNDCTWTWDSNKVGWKVTGKNGNWIFIPDYSSYWTATLDSNNGRKARAFTNDGENTMYIYAGDRKNGYHIRPVISK